MANILSFNDIDTEVNHEPRILDLRLAEALGFQKPAAIRQLIERHKEALERFGEVFHSVWKTTARGGRPSKAYYLNEKQAIYICTKSETENAVEITIALVETFYAVRHGTLQPTPAGFLTPAQQQVLRELVKLRQEETGLAYPAIWERVKRKFQVAKYDQLPQSAFVEVVYYLCTMEDKRKVKALPEPVTSVLHPQIEKLLDEILMEAHLIHEHYPNVGTTAYRDKLIYKIADNVMKITALAGKPKKFVRAHVAVDEGRLLQMMGV